MIRVEFTAFYDLWADLRIRLATLRKSIRKSCSVALTCESARLTGATAFLPLKVPEPPSVAIFSQPDNRKH